MSFPQKLFELLVFPALAALVILPFSKRARTQALNSIIFGIYLVWFLSESRVAEKPSQLLLLGFLGLVSGIGFIVVRPPTLERFAAQDLKIKKYHEALRSLSKNVSTVVIAGCVVFIAFVVFGFFTAYYNPQIVGRYTAYVPEIPGLRSHSHLMAAGMSGILIGSGLTQFIVLIRLERVLGRKIMRQNPKKDI